MDIIVCIKQVPDTETKIKVNQEKKDIEREGINYVINPYDEFGIEEALKIKEKFKEGTVTLITMGPKKAEETIRTGLAMGADKAIHLIDDAFYGADAYATAKALSKVIKDLKFEIIFCGRQAVDDDLAQVGAELAQMLDLPQATVISKLDIKEDRKSAVIQREIEGEIEVLEINLPAVFTTQKGLNEPRYPSLPGIMKAKKKEIKVINHTELGLNSSKVGKLGSKTEIIDMFPPPPRKPGRIIGGTPGEAARTAVRLLREEAKII